MSTIEAVRSFWNAQPCDSTLQLDARYELQRHILPFARFDESRGKTVLEIGCGVGVDTAMFAVKRAKVTAIDLSIESIKLAESWVRSCTQHKVNFIEANAEHLGLYLPPQPFDIIYSFGVIHHTPNPERVFQQLKHYCSPETELRIMLYAKWSLRSFYYLLKGKLKFWNLSEILRSTAETQYGCPVAYFYSFRQVRELMKDYEITNMRKAYIRGLPKRLNFLEKWFGGNILINARPLS